MEENIIVTTIIEILSKNLLTPLSVTDIQNYVRERLKDKEILNLSNKIQNALNLGLDFGLFSIFEKSLYKLKHNSSTDVSQPIENNFTVEPMSSSENEENLEDTLVNGISVLSIQQAPCGPGRWRNQRRGRAMSSSKYRRKKSMKKGRDRRTRRGGRSGPGRKNTPTKKRRIRIVTKRRKTATRSRS